MAIAALSNFTVPLNSDQSASSQGMLMPKLKYRYRLSFENFGVSSEVAELTKQVQDVTRPNLSFTNNVIEIYNSKINYAGKPSWENITVNLRDDVNGYVSKLVGEQNQRQFDFYEQSSSASAGEYKFTLRIEMLDGGNGSGKPTTLEEWEVYGCYLEKTNWEKMDYKEQGPAMITLTIRYDNAVQKKTGSLSGPGIGNPTATQKFPGGNNTLG
jgi:hypothetical protein